MKRTPLAMVAVGLLWAGHAGAKPSEAQCKKLWTLHGKERVLQCKPLPGSRQTRNLGAETFLTPVGTCWDYDVIVEQACGCRKFSRASICCWNKDPSSCPDFRIGNSEEVACGPYGAPKYGASGSTQNEECRAAKKADDKADRCVHDPKVQTVAMGNCDWGIKIRCEDQAAYRALMSETCGPPVEKCRGCVYLEDCSSEEGKECYRKILEKGIWK